MNALVSIDISTLTPATVFAPGGMEGIISKLEAEVRAIDRDISTPEGREAVKSLAYKVARSKTALDEMGKELVAGIKKQAGAIDADRKLARDRLDALKEEVRGPLTAWEEAEKARVEGHEKAIVAIVQGHLFGTPPTSTQIMERQAELSRLVDRDWQEFRERASEAYQDTFPRLEAMREAAEQAERDAAELAELRRLKAEREEQDRANAAIEAAEIAAQQAAERERQRTEQAQRDQEAAVARAIEQERQRAEQEKAAAIEAERRRQEEEARRAANDKAAAEIIERKRQENARHRAKVEREFIADLTQIATGNDAASKAIFEAIARGHIRHVSITY